MRRRRRRRRSIKAQQDPEMSTETFRDGRRGVRGEDLVPRGIILGQLVRRGARRTSEATVARHGNTLERSFLA